MNDQEKLVKKYFKQYLKQGYSKESIRDTLLKFKYPKSIVNANFDYFKGKKVGKENKLKKYFIWTFLIIIAAISISLIYSIIPKDCNYDKNCFIENTIKGKHVIVKEDIAGSTLQYSSKDNTITKQFINFDENEPIEAINLLKDKKIECRYEAFNNKFIDSILGGQEQCTGELLEIILELGIVSE